MSKSCSIRLLIALNLGLSGHLSAQAPDPGEDIRGPKAPVEIPQPRKPPVALWSGIGGGLLLLALGAYLWRKQDAKQRGGSPKEVALASLTELETTRESLPAEAFANRASQTVRQYIAERFRLVAPRLTTEEFLHALAKDAASPLAAESDHLRAFLKSCDLAKFAGSHLDATQRGDLIAAARDFVRVTSQAAAP